MGLWFDNYKITKPVRLIELFAGIGAQAKALENLGVNFEHWKICEFDKYPVCSYNAIHHTNFLPSDITKIHAEDLEIEDTDKYEYIMTYSFPCVTNDSLIYTKEKGYVEFKDLKVGDEVLTKSNTFHRITKIFDNGIHQTCYLDGMGFENIHCTLNHKFYTREMYRKGHKSIRTFREPIFKEVKDLTKKDYFGIPVNQIEESFYTNEVWFWYLIGFYLGDGWIDKYNNKICLAANEKKLKWLTDKVFDHIKYSVYKDKTCYKINIHDKDIYSFVKTYIGTGCETKVVSPKIINLPKNELMAFYEGYLNSDGSIVKGKHQFTSINRNIIYSISMIINKLYLRPTSIYKIKVSPSKKIEGRIVNQKDWYQLRFNPLTNIQDKAFYEDGYIWYPFNKYTLDKEEHVYNMEVEEDHSYIIQGCISKNCQDLSLAGNRKGMSRESGTRSGLLWEVERLLKECNEKGNLPQILCIAENSMVYTREGYKPIEDITTNDYVLTDNGTFQKVLFVKDNGIRECFQVNATGTIPFECTSNHKVLVAHQIKNPIRKDRFLVGKITEPEWIEVKDLKKNDRLCMPINQKEIIPEWSGISSNTLRTVGRKKARNELSEKIKTPEFWYIVGRYIGDGWIVDYNKKNGDSVIICDKKEGLVDLETKVSKVFKCHGYLDTSVCKVQICNGEFVEFLKQFGRGSKGKRLTNIILDLPHDLLESFLMGYIDSDGTYDKKNNRYAISTANKNIALELSQCITKLYSVRPTITYIKPSKSYLKETGQCINGSGSYQVSFMTSQKNKITSFEKEGKIWFPFRSIKSVGNKHVYDIGVENVHSFTVNNVVVHNCMENVPQVIGEGNKKDFDEWYNFLASLGYSSKYKILNSKDFGIPQNRQRCYMVSILGDYEYEFPSGFPLKLTLKDMLEKNVDEKYYLSEKMIKSFTYNSQKQKEKGNGFKFEPTSGEGVAKIITTLAGNRMDDNFLFGNENLNETLEKNKDKLGNDVLSIDAYNKSVHKDISQTITTRVNDSNQHFLYEGVCIDDKFPGSREPRYYDNEAPTIDTHTQLKVVEKSIPIKENTKKGYKEAHVGDGVYTNRVDVKRGTVQKGMIQTITTSPNDIGVVVEDERFKESALKTFNNSECKEGDTIDAFNQRVNDTGISPTITTRPERFKTAILPVVKSEPEIINPLKGKSGQSWQFEQQVYDENGITRAVKAGGGSGNIPKVITEEYLGTYNYNDSDKFIGDRNRENIGKEVSSAVLTRHQDGVIVGSTQKHADVRNDGISPSLTSAMGMGGGQVPMHNYDLRIRKLTPKECWRLMGFEDIDFDNAKKALNDTFYNGEDRSNSQLYKQAGNSIVVNVLMAIFKQLL